MTTLTAPPATEVATGLVAPAARWQRRVDVAIVGTGVAGLSLARALTGAGLSTLLITKAAVAAGSTAWAQGGVATADGADDCPEQHRQDTLTAGAGLCDPEAVDILVREGPAAVADLLAAGARFDVDEAGRLLRTREGGHSRSRIVHAGGDATGAEIQRTLQPVAASVPTLEHTVALDALTDADGAVVGLRVARLDGPDGLEVGEVRARAVVLATGGLGQVYASTTNPAVSTGDGLALALRAGAEVRDLEFVQFHPTVFYPGVGARGRQLLISEALRGEGAVLRDAAGAPVMAGVHPLADLAPRDVVSATMAAAMAAGGVEHLFLDARSLGEAVVRRFPTIVAGCRAAGIDPVRTPIPVAPAAHYSCGGVAADMAGRTSVSGLYAIGEVAATGVHGANRLASNSLLEGLVTARRLAARLIDALPSRRISEIGPPTAGGGVDPGARVGLSVGMARDVGVLRHPAGLRDMDRRLAATAPSAATGLAVWEATNVHTVATALTRAALHRRESRGAHRRTDVVQPQPQWQQRLVLTLAEGRLRTEERP